MNTQVDRALVAYTGPVMEATFIDIFRIPATIYRDSKGVSQIAIHTKEMRSWSYIDFWTEIERIQTYIELPYKTTVKSLLKDYQGTLLACANRYAKFAGRTDLISETYPE